MLLCLGEPPRRFFVMLVDVLHFIFDLHFVAVSSFVDVLHFIVVSSFVVFLHSHFLLDVIPHPSVDYRRVFTPILYFQPSPSQSDSRHFHFSTIPLSSYRERYGFDWAFFTHRRFLPYAPSRNFWHIPNILAQPALIKVSLGAGSYFLESCRASY